MPYVWPGNLSQHRHVPDEAFLTSSCSILLDARDRMKTQNHELKHRRSLRECCLPWLSAPGSYHTDQHGLLASLDAATETIPADVPSILQILFSIYKDFMIKSCNRINKLPGNTLFTSEEDIFS